MKTIVVKERETLLIHQLVSVWEASVKETHLFLSEEEISEIKKYVPDAIKKVPQLIVLEDKPKHPIAFMGVDGKRLEMLFITPEERGKGLGKYLIRQALEVYSVQELTVNEQNPLAKGFYEHMGFKVYKRSEQDEEGNPYPLLYMKRDNDAERVFLNCNNM